MVNIKSNLLLSLVIMLIVTISNASAARRPRHLPYFDKVCKVYGVEGCFVLHHCQRGHTVMWNHLRYDKGYLPASSFKIWNTLIGLETGVLKGTEHKYKWDGKKRYFRSWNKDHSLRSAFKNSVVWYYQRLAREIGMKRMKHYLSAIGYGNQDTSAGIDKFWLEGEMKISAKQQVELLDKLLAGKLPFSQRNIDILKEISILQKTDEFTLHGKTGWAQYPEKNLGWLVGWVEQMGERHIYATNVESPRSNPLFSKSRLAISRIMLRGNLLLEGPPK